MATWLEKVHPDDYAAVATQAAATVATGADFRMDYRLQSPSGEPRWLAVQGRGAPGSGDRFLGVIMDVTRYRESEHERMHLRELLARSGRVSMLGLLASS
ncbi:PAS domain-containing protein, partial [Arthrospira platensis SPKY2]